jgi:hypothetical protein
VELKEDISDGKSIAAYVDEDQWRPEKVVAAKSSQH